MYCSIKRPVFVFQIKAQPAYSHLQWLLEKMTGNDHWSKQILIGCGNQTIRQMFQRLIMHVITQIRNKHYSSHGSIGTGTVSQPWLLHENAEKRYVVC